MSLLSRTLACVFAPAAIQATKFFMLPDNTVHTRQLDDVSYLRLNESYDFVDIFSRTQDCPSGAMQDENNMLLQMDVGYLVTNFVPLQVPDLRKICREHLIICPRATKLEELRRHLISHVCSGACGGKYCLFKCRSRPRKYMAGKLIQRFISETGIPPLVPVICETPTVPDVAASNVTLEETVCEDAYLEIADKQLREEIIREWQATMSTNALKQHVCAVCARKKFESDTRQIRASRLPLYILRNPDLPSDCLPTSYNLDAYNQAILHPAGLKSTDTCGMMTVCVQCSVALRAKVMPKYALANWLYY